MGIIGGEQRLGILGRNGQQLHQHLIEETAGYSGRLGALDRKAR